MDKFFVTLIVLFILISTGALARGGTEQEQQACTRDVQRFCRELMDQGDFTILAASRRIAPSFLSRAAMCWSARGKTIGFPFGVRALSSLNTGFGDLEIWWSRFRRKAHAAFP